MKILIILHRDDFIRHYWHTGAFDALRQEHECLFVVADRCKLASELAGDPGFLGTIKHDDAREREHLELFNVLTWRHRKRSRTFWYRFSRQYKTYPMSSLGNVVRNLKGLQKASKQVLLGNRVVSRIAIPHMIDSLPVAPDLERLVRDARPDLLVFPSSAYDWIGNDVVRIGKALSIKSLFLIDNWDNLSSKTIFWAEPDYLGVWGEQSREHAQRVQNIPPSRVFLAGTPRFEHYYSASKARRNPYFDKPYILFCGSALAFNELEALTLLDRELSAHPEVYGDLQIVYRPHPARQQRLCPDDFKRDAFRHVTLDPQIEAAYYRNESHFQPSLAYYPDLLAGAQLVVCPLTTMMIESLICGTPVLALTYDDGLHYTSPHNAYRYYLHFEGIDRIKGLTLGPLREQMAEQLRSLVEIPPTLSRKEISDSLEYFIHRPQPSYGDGLRTIVATIAG